MKRCKICAKGGQEAVDLALRTGMKSRAIAKQSGFSPSSVWRHYIGCYTKRRLGALKNGRVDKSNREREFGVVYLAEGVDYKALLKQQKAADAQAKQKVEPAPIVTAEDLAEAEEIAERRQAEEQAKAQLSADEEAYLQYMGARTGCLFIVEYREAPITNPSYGMLGPGERDTVSTTGRHKPIEGGATLANDPPLPRHTAQVAPEPEPTQIQTTLATPGECCDNFIEERLCNFIRCRSCGRQVWAHGVPTFGQSRENLPTANDWRRYL